MVVYVTAFFTEDFAPKTGLSPTLDGYRLTDDVQVLTTVAMPEVGGGYYKYAFSAYDEDQEYVLIADGGATLDNVERYKHNGSAEGDIKLIKDDIETIDGLVDTLTTNLDDVIVKLIRLLVLSKENVVTEPEYTDGYHTSSTDYGYDSKTNADTHDKVTGLLHKYEVTVDRTGRLVNSIKKVLEP